EYKAQGHIRCSLLLFDVATGQRTHDLFFLAKPVWKNGRMVQDGPRFVVFSPDWGRLFVGTRSGMLHRWDLTTDTPSVLSWGGHGKIITGLVVSADGETLYSASEDGTVKRWTVDGKEMSPPLKVGQPITSLHLVVGRTTRLIAGAGEKQF